MWHTVAGNPGCGCLVTEETVAQSCEEFLTGFVSTESFAFCGGGCILYSVLDNRETCSGIIVGNLIFCFARSTPDNYPFACLVVVLLVYNLGVLVGGRAADDAVSGLEQLGFVGGNGDGGLGGDTFLNYVIVDRSIFAAAKGIVGG